MLGLFSFLSLFLAAKAITNYQIWCDGNCDRDVVPASTSKGVVLMGGGTDTTEAFLWQIANANGGDFVVLRTSGDDAYNSWIMELSVGAKTKLNSVRTILFKNQKASSEPEILTALRNAEAIFMAGGDQSEYLSYWANTEVQSIIQEKLANITIGGTSAGCMVLGNWVYTGEINSVTSEEALANPYHKYITISKRFLQIPYLESFVTDTHFVTRDRMGRMNTFMARIMTDVDANPPAINRGVGIDEHTALLLNPDNGDIQAVGVGTAYVCTATAKPTVCKKDTPLTFQNLDCIRLSGKDEDTYSFAKFKGTGVTYASNIVSGKYSNLPYGPK